MNKCYITDKELKEAREILAKKGVGWIDGKYIPFTEPEDIQLDKEITVAEMIHSFIAYDNINNKEKWMENGYFADALKTIGKDRLKEMIDYATYMVATVKKDVYVDNENVSYNSIIWKDELMWWQRRNDENL